MFIFLSLLGCELKPITASPEDFPEHLASDYDKDGFSENDGDCNDQNILIGPGFIERCDGLDNDCDGEIDEDPIDGTVWYEDADGDAYGVEAYFVLACTRPEGHVSVVGDCDDADPNINPGSPEICDNNIDNDCDGYYDDSDDSWLESSGTIFYGDVDGDGYGGLSTIIRACSPIPGMVDNNDDCNDEDPNIHPEALEVCDGIDNDCNTLADDADPDLEWSTTTTLFVDADQDGFGDASLATEQGCSVSAGYADNGLDCDDLDSTVHPEAPELCDGIDNDCNNGIDDNAIDQSTWYLDADLDGFGSAETSTLSCTQPSGYSDNSDDCDDSSNLNYPSAPELCDGLDNDCSGYASTAEADLDGDGYVVCDVATNWQGAPILGGLDCDDANQALSPIDNDGDGFSTCAGDCSDLDAFISPASTDLRLDGVDQNCSGEDTLVVIDAMANHDCLLQSSGELVCFGDNSYGQLNAPSGTFTQLSVGLSHSCAVDSANQIQCWGDGYQGQITAPVGTFRAVSAGDSFSCGLSEQGLVSCWGASSGTAAPSGQFVALDSSDHSCAIGIDGMVKCWGTDAAGETQDQTFVAKRLAVNSDMSCAIDLTDAIQCWGSSLGSPPVGAFTDLALNDTQGCAINTAGGIECWGAAFSSPAPGTGVFVDILMASDHGCAVDENDALICWGGGFLTDSDGDGSDRLNDCDDSDASLSHFDGDGDGLSSCAGDCDDADPLIGYTDADGDGDSCTRDCNDLNANLNSLDLDGDGYSSCAGDCDDFDPLMMPVDSDGDSYTLCDGDCVDTDASITPNIDSDGDGFLICEDCDDGDPDAFPGVAIQDSLTACMRDFDGDGWGDDISDSCCYTLHLYDSNESSNGWDGAFLTASLDGVDILEVTLRAGETYDMVPLCLPHEGVLSLDFTGGTWDAEVSYELYSPDAIVYTDGPHPPDGIAYTTTVDFATFSSLDDDNGDGFADCAYRDLVVSGSDCDDIDPTLGGSDIDGDGYSICAGDCDDASADLSPADVDGDGFSTCTGDCDDLDYTDMIDPDHDGFTTCGGDCNNFSAQAYPNALELINDGIDQSCDGSDLVARVVAGDEVSCAIDVDGQISCWGRGELVGNEPAGTFKSIAQPIAYDGVLTNGHAACAINTFGQLECWGDSLCDGAIGFTATDYVQAELGGQGLCVLDDDGAYLCGGCSTTDGPNIGSAYTEGVIQHTMDSEANCVLTNAQEVLCDNLDSNFPNLEGSFTQIASYAGTVCGINLDGELSCMSGVDEGLAVVIDTPQSGSYKMIDVGDGFACALSTGNLLTCWGSEGSERRIAEAPTEALLDVSVGNNHACAVTASYEILCWGDDSYGQASAPATVCMTDVDGDGDGYLVCEGDCDDSDPNIYPVDADGDGYTTCDGDCDDNNPYLNGQDIDGDGSSATCDNDCNDYDASVEQLDRDGDGLSTCDGDCDDYDPLVSNGDSDGDGFSVCDGDCDDFDPDIYLGAVDWVADDIDANCDGRDPNVMLSLGSYSPANWGCVLDDVGDLYCWGVEGSFASAFANIPTEPSVWLSIYKDSACVLDDVGAMTCWGGLMSQNAGLPGQGVYRQVEVGEDHVCALTDIGEIECFANPSSSSSAALTNAPSGTFRKISVGKNGSCGIQSDGSLDCWGTWNDVSYRPSISEPFRDVASGQWVHCAIDHSDQLYCWGVDSYGVASGASSRSSYAYTHISLYDRAACGVLSDGTLDCWGDDSLITENVPSADNFTEVAVGANMACALDDAGALTCWGSGFYGQLDGPDDYCVEFVDLDGDGFSAICSGDCDDTSPAINPADYDSDGITTCQGDCNDFDASVGIDDSDGDGYSECYGLDCDGGSWRNHANASELIFDGEDQNCSGADGTRMVATGWVETCVLRDAGGFAELLCWGDENYGVPDSPELDFTFVAMEDAIACGLDAQGAIHCWGDATYQGVDDYYGLLTNVPTDSGYVNLEIGLSFACAQRADGTLNCWGGYDSFGEQSNAPTVPLRDYGLSAHTGCGVDFNGQIECWGYDTGVGVMSPPAGEFLSVDVQGNMACAINPSQEVVCWGITSSVPTIPKSKDLKMGSEVTCYQTLDGNVHCFGANETLFDLPDADYEQFDITSYHVCGITTDGALNCAGQASGAASNVDIDNDGNDQLSDCDSSNRFVNTFDLDGDGYSSCEGDRDDNDASLSPEDADGDGVSSQDGDCDDNDPNVVPTDADGDGFSVECDNDCDDSDPNIHPYATELVQDGVVSACGEERNVDIAVGYVNHVCAIKNGEVSSNGEVVCWGDNDYGESNAPYQVPMISLSSGNDFTCGIMAGQTPGQGEVICWGKNTWNIISDSPAGEFVELSASQNFACARAVDGMVTCWGDTNSGAGVVDQTFTEPMVQITTTTNHLCGLDSNGYAQCWGSSSYADNYVTQVPLTRFARLEGGDQYVCGMRHDGTIDCWGDAIPASGTSVTTKRIEESYSHVFAGEYGLHLMDDNGVVTFDGTNYGYQHYTPPSDAFEFGSDGKCLIGTENELWCATNQNDFRFDLDSDGSNLLRDCDDSDSFYTHFDLDGDGYSTCDGECDDDSLVDMIDQDGDGVSICDLDCDDSDSFLNTLDADNDGISTCDGDSNDTGHPMDLTDSDNDGFPGPLDCANGDSRRAPGLDDWVQDGIDQDCDGVDALAAISLGGSGNQSGDYCVIRADGGRYCRYLDYPSEIFTAQDPSNVHLVTGPLHNVCGLDASGQLTCYGDDYYGVVSNAPTTPQVDVALGYYHACSLDENGVVSCWGNNSSGQTSVPSLGTVVQVALTDYASCARENTGQVTCWGDGAYVPTAPSNVHFDFIDAHGDTICGITRDREILCWSDYGNIVWDNERIWGAYDSVSVGEVHACATRQDGTLRCWGSAFMVPTPPDVFVQVESSGRGSCGITDGGELKCWGGISVSFDISNDDNDAFDVLNDCNDFDASVGQPFNGVCQ